MSVKKNPLNLNALQLKTLTLFQELARHPQTSSPLPGTGDVMLPTIPMPHGNHFHIGSSVVSSQDANGLSNPNVWTILERKGLIRYPAFPTALILTAQGLSYETGLRDKILHGSDH